VFSRKNYSQSGSMLQKKYCSYEYNNLLILLNYYIKEMKLIKQKTKIRISQKSDKVLYLYYFIFVFTYCIVYNRLHTNDDKQLFKIIYNSKSFIH